MALDLERYYEEELPNRQSLRDAVENGIGDILNLIETVDFSEDLAWRYFVGEEVADDPQKDFSQSTTSMIAAAIQGAHGKVQRRAAHGYRWHRSSMLPPLGTGKAQERLEAAKKRLKAEWEARGGQSNSSTYGQNDILTLSWYLDLFGSTPDAAKLLEELERLIISRCETIAKTEGNANPGDALNAGFKKLGERMNGTTMYILLRFVRCERALRESSQTGVGATRKKMQKKAFQAFQVGLREQLSYGDVGDSRFDPCELAFCLEGLLHTRPETIDDATAVRVFDIIHAAQERSAVWRPQTPLTTSHRGEVLYAIGIETATSILCSLSILDGRTTGRRSSALGHTHLRVILKYWDWLKGRRLPLSLPTGEVMGWRSERLGASYLHIWENSQILEFLVIFRDYLDQHIAGELLELSELEAYVPEMPDETSNWQEIAAKYEPVETAPYRLYEDIGRSFVTPRLNQVGEELWSMLLYGPPGTGKTTTAENLAAALGLPLIKVTVSDFLTTGDGHMERRAKLIFEVLRHQMTAVVLFDELDQLLLDRDSLLFRQQSSAFQLLTPGMLTKLAELRDAETVIFILATNYDDRIDSAIKRPGRVDVAYLCLPPDMNKRRGIIKSGLKKAGLSATEDELAALARAAIYLGYKGTARMARQASSLSELLKAFNKEPRDIQFNAFKERAEALIKAGKPPTELVGLTMMALESVAPAGESQPRFVIRLAALLEELQPDQRMPVRDTGEFDNDAFEALVALAKA